jgi:hypothetical protein
MSGRLTTLIDEVQPGDNSSIVTYIERVGFVFTSYCLKGAGSPIEFWRHQSNDGFRAHLSLYEVTIRYILRIGCLKLNEDPKTVFSPETIFAFSGFKSVPNCGLGKNARFFTVL